MNINVVKFLFRCIDVEFDDGVHFMKLKRRDRKMHRSLYKKKLL